MNHGSHCWIAWHFGVEPRKPLRRKRRRKAKQLSLFRGQKKAEAKTTTGKHYQPDPSRSDECPWDE